MRTWLAQRGTKVALIDAPSARAAGEEAARVLRLPQCRPRRWVVRDGNWLDDGTYEMCNRIIGPDDDDAEYHGPRKPWPRDWRGAGLRPATASEVAAWNDARNQQSALRGLSRKKIREAFA